jgi:hypothetical protein
MSFAKTYLEKNQVYPFQINQIIEKLKYCIIIPCYNEPDILNTLDSLIDCTVPENVFAVIICINSNEKSSNLVLEQNEKSCKLIQNWIETNQKINLHFFVTHHKNIPYKFRGAGMARKLAMDEAINLFQINNNPEGVIISLDADVEVQNNFLTEIDSYYSTNSKVNGAVHYFEHPISGNDFPETQYEAIVNYEMYLRYFNQALRFTGFPYAFHTVGSCFSVRAKTYCAQSGMNRQHAGEDFYFIQKIAELGKFGEINSTTIYPSSRISDRVPFGTGPEIEQIINSNRDDYLVYNFDSFIDIKKTLASFINLYNKSESEIERTYSQLPDSMKKFLKYDEFLGKVTEVNKNTSTEKQFLIRFLKWFNAFKIIKYLNFIHETKYYQKEDVFAASMKLLTAIQKEKSINTKKDMLLYLRDLDKNGYCYFNLLQQL